MSDVLLSARNLVRTFEHGAIRALDGVGFDGRVGEVIAIMGPSGCGKSTLLALLGLLDRPDAGEIVFAGQSFADVRHAHAFRARNIGFVFQAHHLVPTMTLQENVEAALMATGVRRAERADRAAAMLAAVGLAHRARHLPAQTSGGERQRAAVARALANRPRLLLADEPTGNLDSDAGRQVTEHLVAHARSQAGLALIATHNPEVAAMADRCLTLRDGRWVGERPIAAPNAQTGVAGATRAPAWA